MKTIRIPTKEPYDVLIGSGILPTLGQRVRALHGSRRQAVVVCDDKVRSLYAAAAVQSLQQEGLAVTVADFPRGESHKDMETVMNLLDQFVATGLAPGDLVVALGGGVTADLAGFTAGIYRGGVDWVLAPTSLVAAVDSSVGGTVSVGLSGRKDIASLCHQPCLVLCDTDTLRTLDGELLLDGMAQIVLRACVRDAELFQRLETGNWKQDLIECIARAVELKSSMSGDDMAQVLSFGGQVAKGLEELSRNRLSLGKATAVGMCVTGEACVKHGLLDPVDAHRIRRLLEHMGLPTRSSYGMADICRASIKTGSPGQSVELVLLERVGKASVRRMDTGELSSFYQVVQ